MEPRIEATSASFECSSSLMKHCYSTMLAALIVVLSLPGQRVAGEGAQRVVTKQVITHVIGTVSESGAKSRQLHLALFKTLAKPLLLYLTLRPLTDLLLSVNSAALAPLRPPRRMSPGPHTSCNFR